MNYVVKTTEFAGELRAGRGNGVFSGFTKRITLLKQRNSRGKLRGGRDRQRENCAGGGVLAHKIGGVRLTPRIKKTRKRLRHGL